MSHRRELRLPCPTCEISDALTCGVTMTGEGFWVTLRSQACPCDIYAQWNTVWWQARTLTGWRPGQQHHA